MPKFLLALLLTLSISQLPAAAPEEPDADTLFAPERLIQVEVTMAPEDWHALRIGHRVAGEGFSQIVDNPYETYRADVVIDGHALPSVGIRKKGFFGSAVSTRPSLKLDLDKHVKGRRFAGQDMLTFNNNNQDPTQAQTSLVYSFMSAAGAKAPRSNFARIVVNGEDLGVYSHVESVRKPFIKRLFGKSKGDLWEGYAGDFTPAEYGRIVHKWGKDEAGASLQALYDLLQDPAPLALAEVEKLLDLDAFLTLWASEVLIGHWDGYASNRNNFYLYREPRSGLFYFTPWGPDSAFWDPGPFLPAGLPKSFKARGHLCQRLWEVPEVRERYRVEMQRLLEDVWDEDRLLAQLEQARVLTEPWSTVRPEAAERSRASIRAFVAGRRAEVQAELDREAVDWPADTRSADVSAGPPMEISGEFSAVFEVPAEAPAADTEALFPMASADLLGAGEASLSYTIEGTRHAPFTRYGVRATPGDPDFIREGYPVIELIATSDSGHPPWRLRLILDPHQLAAGRDTLAVDHFTVWALLSQGEPGGPDLQTTAFGVAGTLELDAFGREPGAPVSGRFALQTAAFKPGDG